MTDNPHTAGPSLEGWERLGFNDRNISSIGGSNASVDVKIEICQIINTNEDKIKSLMDATGFKAINLSSILAGSGINFEENLKLLLSHENKLRDIIYDSDFEPKNISHILHGFKNFEKNVNDLYECREKLKEIKDVCGKEKHGFKTQNLSSILSGHSGKLGAYEDDKGNNKDGAIDILYLGAEELKFLSKHYKAPSMSEIFANIPTELLVNALDRWNELLKEPGPLNGNVPANAETHIHDTSPASVLGEKHR